MQRRVFLLLAAILTVPAFANAATLGLDGGTTLVEVAPNTSFTLTLVLDPQGSTYVASDLLLLTNGGNGPAPAVDAIFGDTGGTIPGAGTVGSIWAGGSAGINLGENGTTTEGSGLKTGATFQTANSGEPRTDVGIYATLTFNTNGVNVGDYFVDLSGTTVTQELDENFEPTFLPTSFGSFTIRVVPEPSSIVLGTFAAAGLAAVAIRRRRAA